MKITRLSYRWIRDMFLILLVVELNICIDL